MKYLTGDLVDKLKKLCIAHDPKDKNAMRTLEENCHSSYKEAVEHFEEMSVHVYGTKPTSLLEKTRPREDADIRQYRLDTYEPITKSTCKKGLGVVTKIFNPKLSSIRFPTNNEKAAELEKYSMLEYPRFNSVMNYLESFALKRVISDPNGIFLVQPLKVPTLTTETIRPIVTCYLSKDIHDIGEDHALLFDGYQKLEKSQVWFYTYANKEGIYKLKITKATSQEPTIEEFEKYEHFRGQVPFWFLGGEFSDRFLGLYESYFYAAVPFWNEVIMDHSDLRGVIRLHMFPKMWEVADECEYVEDGKYECTNGTIFPENAKPFTCPGCKGAGRKTVKSPYESYLVNKDRFTNPDGSVNPTAPFGYVEPGTETTKILKAERDEGLTKGLSALNMDVLNNIGTNQSGVSKDIDRRTELQEFLQKIANNFFDVHLPNIFDWFAWYMFAVQNGNSEEKIKKFLPEISKPVQFDVYTASELTEQLKGAKEAKVNPSYLAVKQSEVQNKEFATHPELLEVLNLELALDPLAEISRDEIAMMLMNMTITRETAIIHDNIRTFVKRAISEDEKFKDLEYTEQIEILKAFAQEVIEETKISIELPTDADSPGL